MIQANSEKEFDTLKIQKYSNDLENYLVRKKGTSHSLTGTVCQDYCMSDMIEDIFITAVADGHGGEAYDKSDIGSRLACEQLIVLVKELFIMFQSQGYNENEFVKILKSTTFKKTLITRWHKAVLLDYSNSDRSDNNISESNIIIKYGTTLLFTIVTQSWIVAGQIGDGAILLFNENGYYQFHRREGIKIGSQTPGSMCSSRAQYSFLVSAYKRSIITDVLLSTDGIYDKLAIHDSFYRYALKLIAKARNGEFEKSPFQIVNNGQEKDLHILSKDDCTLSLICTADKINESLYDKALSEKYTDIELKKTIGQYNIYTACKEGLQYTIHEIKNSNVISCPELKCCDKYSIIKPVEKIIGDNGYTYIVYPVFSEIYEISSLIEACYHMEKSYSEDHNEKFDNLFWLSVVQEIKQVENMLSKDGIALSDLQYQIMSVDEKGYLMFYDDGFTLRSDDINMEKNIFEGYFSIIGKIIMDNFELPIFAPNTKGQIIPVYLQGEKEDLKFGRTVLNSKNGDIWLENLSDYNWMIGNDTAKIVEPTHFLRLSGNKDIFFKTNDDTVTYHVIMF